MKQSLFEVNKNIKEQKAEKEAEIEAIAEERVKRLKVWENTGKTGQEVKSLKEGIENDKKNPKKFKESDFKFQLLKDENVLVGMPSILERTKEIMKEM